MTHEHLEPDRSDRMSTARSSVLVLVAVLGAFAIFHLGVFPLFRNIADLSDDNTGQLRAVFLGLFAGMIGSALLAGALAGRVTRAPWPLVVVAVVPTIVLLGFFSFYLLEFWNACDVGDSLFVDARC